MGIAIAKAISNPEARLAKDRSCMFIRWPFYPPAARGGYDAGMSIEFKPGDIVRIKRGALAGLKGVVLNPADYASPEWDITKLSDAVLLSVEMNGREGGATIPPEFLEPA